MLHYRALHAGVILDPCSAEPSHLLAQTFASPCMSSALTIPANIHRPFQHPLNWPKMRHRISGTTEWDGGMQR